VRVLIKVAMSTATKDALAILARHPDQPFLPPMLLPTIYGVPVEIDDDLPYGHLEPTYGEGVHPEEIRTWANRLGALIEGMK